MVTDQAVPSEATARIGGVSQSVRNAANQRRIAVSASIAVCG
jgi:hypothetical protein